jgi:adenosylmethionine-8-amino-7-oxononanoate aminotransferase
MTKKSKLVKRDQRYLLHPLHHPGAHKAPLIIESGHGIWVKTIDGKEYIDGLSGLWNILIGHGNRKLAKVAKKQMEDLAYFSNYVGVSNIPAIELANKLAGYAYPSLNTTFFASGGAEANESAFKTARYYWKRMGKPDKVKVIARQDAYHGVTLATMSATGIAPYWLMFEPRVPNVLHTHAPYPYRYEGDVREGETIGKAAARALEETIIREDPDTVAAFIAEPVQGAGGVIVPPDDYFPATREICDKYDVLFIADEVITGFGRTGEWFGLQHWGVEPDIMAFAKGVTSGYLPLGGIQISDKIRETIMTAPAGEQWMHAYTYSGHATCCAVAIANIDILERENVAERAKDMGARLLEGLQGLSDFECVGNVRGLGLMCAVEFVADRETKESAGIAGAILKECLERGLISRIKGESILFAPPLIINEEEVDQIVSILRDSIAAVWSKH